ncbi:MAG TPA: hypothetical protein VFF48_03880 [Brevundimonas sp.]|nr:hypothetical protein [Brevundimonas sp.]
MTVVLSVVVLGILGVAVVAWAARKKLAETRTGPREGDTAWNDPVSSADPATTPTPTDRVTDTPPASAEPRP